MSRNLELERQHMPLVNSGQKESDNKRIVHGVSPQTHGLLIAAQKYNAFANIDPTTRNSIAIYYGTEVSLTELHNYIEAKGSRKTVTKRILKGLDRAWEQLPLQAQLQLPKEQAVKLKDFYVSSGYVAKHRKTAVTLWQDKSYRQKIMEGIQRHRHDPNFIQGQGHTPERIQNIKSSLQKRWNERHGIPTNDPLAKRTELVAEWQRLFILLGHSPSFTEIAKLKKEGRTRFSKTMYKTEFGQGSSRRARETLTAITEAEVLSTIAKKSSLITSQIGENERSMWQHVIHHDLIPNMIQRGLITKQEVNSLRDYFENGRRIGQNLTIQTFNKFTIAVAKVA